MPKTEFAVMHNPKDTYLLGSKCIASFYSLKKLRDFLTERDDLPDLWVDIIGEDGTLRGWYPVSELV